MKTFAAVLCAMLATGGIAFAHGTAGGGPVMPSGPVTQSSSSTRFGAPVFSPVRLSPQATGENNRRHPKPPAFQNFSGPTAFLWEPKLCLPQQYLFTPDGVVELNEPYECGFGFTDVASGPVPLWLTPAFLW